MGDQSGVGAGLATILAPRQVGIWTKRMIIRDALRCETCGKPHVVRIGMGQEESQQHRFPCRNCGEDIAVTRMVDYKNTRSWVVSRRSSR